MKTEPAGKAAEYLVNEFCNALFIKYWTFANPVCDNGKELCDCLVVCHGAVIILSIKDCQNTTNEDRWFKKAIEKSERQIIGAERYLERGGVIKTDKGVILAIPKEHETIRIGIAFGHRDEYSELPKITTGKNGRIIHWFDDSSFIAAFTYTQTFSNFLKYLGHREDVCLGNNSLVRELNDYGFLAIYLNQNSTYIVESREDGVQRSQKLWTMYLQSEEYQEFLKKERNNRKFCSIIDWVVEQIHHDSDKEDSNRILSEFAALPLTARSYFIEQFEFLSNSNDKSASCFRVPKGDHEQSLGVVLLVEGFPIVDFYSTERDLRRQKLLCYCKSMIKDKGCNQCIGLATNKNLGQVYSFDACIVSDSLELKRNDE